MKNYTVGQTVNYTNGQPTIYTGKIVQIQHDTLVIIDNEAGMKIMGDGLCRWLLHII